MNNQQFGTYRIISKIGDGAFGVVYKAYHPFLDREVAIKTLKTAHMTDTEQEQRFMREARTIARLRHTNIVTIHEFATTPVSGQALTYLVMEYLNNFSLDERLADGRHLSAIEAILILEQLAAALDYAHARGVIHRDLKPANILFNDAGQPVIVDFGLAKLVAATGSSDYGFSSPFESSLMGTPAYMAPEQVTNRDITPAADQYALALLAYRMLTGQHPFNLSGTIFQMLHDRVDSQPLPLNEASLEYSQGAADVMQRALHAHPAERYASCGEFVRELGRELLPDRYIPDIVTVTDPMQLLMLQVARQTLARGMYLLAGLALMGLLILLGIILNGYKNGAQAIYVWDGIYSYGGVDPDGSRIILGTFPGSPAETAGILPGDKLRGDLLLDTAQRDGRYTINSLPRHVFSTAWQPGPGDVVERSIQRGDNILNIRLTLDRSPYLMLLFGMYGACGVAIVLVAVWLLRRWGAEPGLQVFFALLLLAAASQYAQPLVPLVPFLGSFLFFAAFALIGHFFAMFPKPLAIVTRLRWLLPSLYLPILLPFGMFITAQNRDSGFWYTIPMFISASYILIVTFFIWQRGREGQADHRNGLRWFYIAGILMFVFGLGLVVLRLLTPNTLQAIGMTAFAQDMLYHVMRNITILSVLISVALGYHRIQWALGSSLPAALGSDQYTSLGYADALESKTLVLNPDILNLREPA
jgi:tRNA A-37 threonylcarbamoyl transferase component Bud32